MHTHRHKDDDLSVDGKCVEPSAGTSKYTD